MSSLNIDVLIVGGGPAGSSTALSILKYSNLSVLILDSSNLDAVKVGESVSSSIFNLLNYVDIQKNDLDNEAFTSSYTTLAAWGSDQLHQQHSIFSTMGESVQLNRHYFDNFLLLKVDERGGHILPNSKIVSFEKVEDYWEINAFNPELGELKIISKYLVDATGRNRSLARKMCLAQTKMDDLTAIGCFLKFNSKKLVKQTLMETVTNGWFYTSTLPGNTLNLTFFSSAKLIKENSFNDINNFNRLIHSTKYVKQLLDSSYENNKLWGKSACSSILKNPYRNDYIAVGDAVAAFDPISSLGIGFAFSSGLNAAKCIIDFEKSLIQNYNSYYGYIENTFTNYLATRSDFYRKEKRWQESKFWIN